MSTVIKPTVGRVVWYWPSGMQQKNDHERADAAGIHSYSQPLAATIAHVNDNGTINIGYLTNYGDHKTAQFIPLLQEGENPVGRFDFCSWMPYQLGQAKKNA